VTLQYRDKVEIITKRSPFYGKYGKVINVYKVRFTLDEGVCELEQEMWTVDVLIYGKIRNYKYASLQKV
jgi:hypothetical protein